MTTVCEFRLQGEDAQERLGGKLARACVAPALIFLYGDLGAGKTTLVRGFLRALGYAGSVKSPTYTLIEPYDTVAGRVYHLDLYRLGNGEELEYLGLREMLAERALLLIEWPQRGVGWLPVPDLAVHIEHAGDARALHIRPQSPRGEAILAHLDVG